MDNLFFLHRFFFSALSAAILASSCSLGTDATLRSRSAKSANPFGRLPVIIVSEFDVLSSLSTPAHPIATRILLSMNQAVRCDTPIARLNSLDLMPSLTLAIAQTATNHLSNPIGLSSNGVPTLELNCFRQSLHRIRWRVCTAPIRPEPHVGHTGSPPYHLIARINSSQASDLAK